MPISRAELQFLAQSKADDAALLFAHARYANAYYLAGYAIEIALKACIANQFQQHVMPDKDMLRDLFVHDLNKLVTLAGLRGALSDKRRLDEFDANWTILEAWRPESRYEIVQEAQSRAMIEAVTNEENGVLTWIKANW